MAKLVFGRPYLFTACLLKLGLPANPVKLTWAPMEARTGLTRLTFQRVLILLPQPPCHESLSERSVLSLVPAATDLGWGRGGRVHGEDVRGGRMHQVRLLLSYCCRRFPPFCPGLSQFPPIILSFWATSASDRTRAPTLPPWWLISRSWASTRRSTTRRSPLSSRACATRRSRGSAARTLKTRSAFEALSGGARSVASEFFIHLASMCYLASFSLIISMLQPAFWDTKQLSRVVLWQGMFLSNSNEEVQESKRWTTMSMWHEDPKT